jgi:V/A-type H+-transporting ATPase subunit I
MFRPEKMSFVNISVLDEHLTQVLDRLTKLGVMHVVDKEELPPSMEELRDIDVEPVKDRLGAVNSRIEELLTILAIEDGRILPNPLLRKGELSAGVSEDKIEIDPFQVAEKVEVTLSDIEAAVNPVVQRRGQIQTEVSGLEENSRQLSALEAQGVNLEDLREMRFLYFAFGDIPAEYYNRLAGSLANVRCVLVPGGVTAGRRQILAFALVSDKEKLSNALEAAYFSRYSIPEKYHGPIADVLDEVELEIWTRREEMAELQGEIRSLRQRWRNKLLELHATIATNQVVIESVEKFGKTDRSYFLSGWVPHKDVRKLQKELEKMTGHGILMNASDPIAAHKAEHHEPKVPTKLRHPFFLRPFTGLITNFGIPDYSGIDPTPFASLAFLAMFGIMFADVGHGGVLLLLGLFGALYPLPQFKAVQRLSTFLACCGVASMIFGFVFGSVFGKEEIIKPLWFSLENMNPDSVILMLKLGVFFGVGMLSLGVSLSIAQSFRRKNFKEALCGQWGIFSLVFYWMAASLAFLSLTGRQLSYDKILILLLLLVPIILREPVSRLISKKGRHDEEEAESIIESGFQIYEMVLAYLANTLSYIRIAAFNLSHAGLMMAEYSLTKTLSGDGNIFLSLPSDIMSNAFVIALEGLIVMIQCMRLEYYEFFSKFFAGEGIEYKPLRI